MISRKAIVALVLIVSAGAFAVGAYVYQRNAQLDQQAIAISQSEHLVRMHSPVLGPREAPVTIVEFFDPACETCRAFYPIVKDLMRQYPSDGIIMANSRTPMRRSLPLEWKISKP